MSRSGRVRVLIIGYRKFSELINAVMPEFEHDAEVTIVESVANANTDYRSLIERHSPDVVASAGSNAAYLATTLALPVISQPVTDTDLIEALAKARRISRHVHLFTYQPENQPPPRLFDSLPGLLDMDLVLHGYSTSGEANEKLQLALAEQSPDVVVGPSYTCHMAEQQGLPTILSYSKESARTLLHAAIKAGRAHLARADDRTARVKQEQFIIRSAALSRAAQMAQTYARGPGAVLVQGESGTGKEHMAKEIHRHSDYSQGPLVAVNCGSIPNDLFESEMFGYVEGAFTSSRRGGRVGLIEQANGGVLYLDEVGEMPMSQQVKLLRVLQEKCVRPVGCNREMDVDFKLIAATNRDLRGSVERGDFRDDLYYRLNVFSLTLPPLRERPEDIEAIACYYLAQYARQHELDETPASLYARVKEPFSHYGWPGNVRELQNFAERLVVNLAVRPDRMLSAEDVAAILPELASASSQDGLSAATSLRGREAAAIRRAMEKFAGDKARVADYLGISTTTLWRRLRAMQAERQDAVTQFSGGN